MNIEKLKNQLEKFFVSNLNVFISLTFLILVVYFQAFNFSFTSLDDYDLILNKFYILNRLDNLKSLFKSNLLITESGIYYRPIVSLTFMIDTIIGGKGAFIFHLSNIIYHIIASFLFFVLMYNFLQNKFQSFLFSVLFSIHPALSQAVVWIPGRNDSLLFIFLALTFLLFKNYLKSFNQSNKKNILFLILSSFSFLISLLIKENAILILIFIILFTFFYMKEKIKWRIQFVNLLTYATPILIYIFLRSQAKIQKIDFENIPITFTDYLKGIINYIGKIFLPFNLNVITLPENINLIYGIISIICLLIFALRGIRNKNIFFFGILWFLFFLISGIVGFVGFTNFLDHRLYVPIFGIFLAISQFRLFERISLNILAFYFIPIFILFIYLNIAHTRNFKDPITFYRSAILSTPNSFFVQRGIANVYHRMKDYNKAENHYRKSLELNPTSIETLVNLGINFKLKGELDSAEYYFLRAIKINPDNPKSHNNLGNLYLQKNEFALAEYHFLKAIGVNPNYYEAYNNLGVLYARLMKDTLAYVNFLKSIQINPDFAEGYFNLALFFYNKSKIDSSRFYYSKSIEKGFPEKNILNEKLNYSR